PNISRQDAIKALEAVGANTFVEKLPNQYDENVTEGGSTFSLGERQLISFARALAFDPLNDLYSSICVAVSLEVEGRELIIVEDIIDSGLTLSYLVDLFKYRKAKSVKIVTLLDKPEGRTAKIKADVIGF